MKKYLLGIAVLLMGTAVMTSCSDSDNGGDGPHYQQEEYSTGAYLVNSSWMGDSWLTGIDYASATATNYFCANEGGQSLGRAAKHGVVYGSKIYVTLSADNAIAVIDKATKQLVKTISTFDLMGGADGMDPEAIMCDGGKLYFTVNNDIQASKAVGHVVAIDTTNYAVQDKWQVEYNAQSMVKIGDRMFVGHVGRTMDEPGAVSWVNLSSGKVEQKDFEGVYWVEKLFAVNNQLFALNMQFDSSDDEEHSLLQLDPSTGKSTTVCDGILDATVVNGSGTRMSVSPSTDELYVLEKPYSADSKICVLRRYEMGTNDKLKESAVIQVELPTQSGSPYKIAVDPLSRNIFLFCSGEDTDGSVLECDKSGKVLHEYQVGNDVCDVFFDSAVRTVMRE